METVKQNHEKFGILIPGAAHAIIGKSDEEEKRKGRAGDSV